MTSLEVAFGLVDEVERAIPVSEDELRDLTTFVIEAEGGRGAWDVTVALVSDARLQNLHREFMGVDTPTDIMTFPLEDEGNETRGGELVISADHVSRGAWGLKPADELRYLVIHGLLHLLGWQDETDSAREAMLARQDDLLRAWERGMRSGAV